MPIYNFKGSPADLGDLTNTNTTIYGLGEQHPTYEYEPPQFALFFKNPPFDSNPQAFRNFCFDDNFGNKFEIPSINSTKELVLNRFIRLFRLDMSIPEFVFPEANNLNKFKFQKTSNNGNKDKNMRIHGSKFNAATYLVPWLGIPIDLSSTVNPSVTIPISNAWRLHGQPRLSLNQNQDSYWRSKLPNKNDITLELYTEDLDISAVWNRNGQSALKFNFKHDQQDNSHNIGEYQDNRHNKNIFDEQITITLSATTSNQGRIIQNEDKPRRLYIIWKRSGLKKNQVVGSIAILPMPVIDHYMLFLNIQGSDTDADLLEDQWTISQLTSTGPQFIPSAFDLADNTNNHRQLGSVANDYLLNQYGIRLNVINQPITQEVYYQSTNPDGTIAFTQVDFPTVMGNVTDVVSTNWTGLNPQAVYKSGIQNNIRRFIFGAPTTNNLAGNTLLGPDVNGQPALRRINIQSAGNNLHSHYSNLTIVCLCNSTTFGSETGPMTLGEGTTPVGSSPITPTPNTDFFYCNQNYQSVVRGTFPNFIYLYDAEFSGAPLIRGNMDGGVSCFRESTLIHELLHNLGLGHVFQKLGRDNEDGVFLKSYFSNNLRYYNGTRLSKVKLDTSTQWRFKKKFIPFSSNKVVDQQNRAILNLLNQLTGSTDNQDLAFNYLDILSYYGFDALVQLFHAGRNNLINGYRTPPSPTGLYQLPLNPISIPLSRVSTPVGTVIGNDPWIVFLRHISLLFQHSQNNASVNLYTCTYPPVNNPTDTDNPYHVSKNPVGSQFKKIIPSNVVATIDPLQSGGGNSRIYDEKNGNRMDYTFAGTLGIIRSSQIFNDSNGIPSVRTDNDYLVKHQWDIIRHTIRHYNRI